MTITQVNIGSRERKNVDHHHYKLIKCCEMNGYSPLPELILDWITKDESEAHEYFNIE